MGVPVASRDFDVIPVQPDLVAFDDPVRFHDWHSTVKGKLCIKVLIS